MKPMVYNLYYKHLIFLNVIFTISVLLIKSIDLAAKANARVKSMDSKGETLNYSENAEPYTTGYIGTNYSKIKIGDRDIVQNIMKKRRNRIRKYCADGAKYPAKRGKDPYDSSLAFVRDKSYGLFYCKVNKAGSSTCGNIILQLHGVHDDDQIVRLGVQVHKDIHNVINWDNEVYGNQSVNPTKFLVTRHPFSRIISFYRDKLESSLDTELWSVRMRKIIVSKYMSASKINGTDREHPTFTESVRYIVDRSVDLAEPHYRPISTWCDVCHYDYSYIIKMESFRRDTVYVMNQLGIDKHVTNIPISRKFSFLSNSTLCEENSVGMTRDDCLYRHYFQQLKPHLVRRLHKKYKNDFTLFGYGFTDERIISLD